MIELRLAVDQFQDAARGGQSQRYLRIGPGGGKGGEFQQTQDAEVGDHRAEIEDAGTEEQQRVDQSARVGQAEQQGGDIARLKIALMDKCFAHLPRVDDEPFDLRMFLRGTLHDLDAIQRFGQMGVHFAEAGTYLIGDGRKPFEIARQRNEIDDRENDRGDDQRDVITRREDQRHHDEHERANHQVDARAEHVVHLAHVVGGARHRVAHGLQVVEGHALAEQREV